jgi:cytochrome d ubiquinol oxidase subunit II
MFNIPNLYYSLPIPLITLISFIFLFKNIINTQSEYKPFFLSIAIFALGYIGLAISIYPWIIPYHYTFKEAAAAGPSLSLVLLGVVPLLPLILFYTGYCYYVFRGKTTHERMY